jgi:hypothetical protein
MPGSVAAKNHPWFFPAGKQRALRDQVVPYDLVKSTHDHHLNQ